MLNLASALNFVSMDSRSIQASKVADLFLFSYSLLSMYNLNQRYGYKDWFPLAREDNQRFGQNLFFSFVDNSTLATFAVSEWHGEIVQYHYVSIHRAI